MAAILMGVSTHILDIAIGRPARAVPVSLQQHMAEGWHTLAAEMTDAEGRVARLLPAAHTLSAGTYRIVFDTAAYFAAQSLEGLYPLVEIVFTVRDPAGHYHIPLLLSANGYSTYRGS